MTERTIIHIEGMQNAHCRDYVTTILSSTYGVVKNWVDFDARVADVTYDSSILTREQLVKLINRSETYRAN